ncbi:molybdopterin-dependent oxidoreductase [Pseudolysinimonas sp.]|uniref:molybdopterin-dependent oxidoreductase n=1 Tax=Pseudolysinimonas sp. TaxID=2680009 RepID=UPI00286A0616|nr:molybdopterin-dependent oxidoreductase [Pseudolysinimonas sp.]
MTERRFPSWLFPAIAGVAAVAFGLGVAELVAGLLAPRASPVLVVGSLLIDVAPSWAKDAAIALFGTADKVALLVGIGVVLVALAAAAGVLQSRRPLLARLLIAAGGIFGIVAAVTRAGASILDAVPATVATVAATLALTALLNRRPVEPPPVGDLSRRRFLSWAGGAGVIGALAAVSGFALQSGARVVTAVRETFTLPTPDVAAAPVPAGAELGVNGLTPVITPNADFYRIDTALQVPNLDPATWRLRIHGLVENEIELTWDELIALPLEESHTTLMCVSNPVGGELVGTALWLGYPIRELLARAKPTSDADMVLSRSSDGFSASSPLEALTDDRNAILAIGMNGEPLPLEHGFPVRMVVPGLYGYVSATKWVVELQITRFDKARGYWTDRGWSARGPVKISSRIDVPRGSASAGEVVVAGVAWHQHTGIAGVEVSIDDGPWRDAELASAISEDTWVQWRYRWDADPGSHVLKVRATSVDGEVQTAELAGVAPDGATGHHTVTIDVVE